MITVMNSPSGEGRGIAELSRAGKKSSVCRRFLVPDNDATGTSMMNMFSHNIDHPLLLLATAAIAFPVIWHFWRWMLADDAVDAGRPALLAVFRARCWAGELAALKMGLFLLLCAGVVSATYKMEAIIFLS